MNKKILIAISSIIIIGLIILIIYLIKLDYQKQLEINKNEFSFVGSSNKDLVTKHGSLQKGLFSCDGIGEEENRLFGFDKQVNEIVIGYEAKDITYESDYTISSDGRCKVPVVNADAKVYVMYDHLKYLFPNYRGKYISIKDLKNAFDNTEIIKDKYDQDTILINYLNYKIIILRVTNKDKISLEKIIGVATEQNKFEDLP